MSTMTMTLVKKKPRLHVSTIIGNARFNTTDHTTKFVLSNHIRYVSWWDLSKDQGEFKIVTKDLSTGVFGIFIEMEAEAAEQATLSVWQLLDRGTETRPMHVSPDWLSKTVPRGTKSGPGKGYKTGIRQPWKPGIIAREIAVSIAEKQEASMDNSVKAYYELALGSYFGN